MAVSAKFVADFTQFNQAVEKATAELRTFESGIGRVDKDLAKFGNQFSGTKVIQDATLMAKAIEDIGGASKLTAKEQERVNAQATEAIAKFKALGQTAPKALLDLEEATRRADDGAKGLNARMVALGSAIGTFAGNLAANALQNAASGLFNMGKAAFDTAGQILDLSNKTGLSTDAIQEMQYVADQTGASLEQFTQAAFQLGIRLSGGSDSVKAAVEALGMSWQDLRTQSPDAQFDAVVAALGRMDNATARNEVGVALFGKAFGNVAAAVSEGYRQMANQAEKSSEDQLKALDKTSDAWSRFVTNTSSMIRSGLGASLKFIEDQWEFLLPVVDENGRAYKFVGESVAKTTAAVKQAIPSLEEIEDRQREAAQAAAEHARQIEAAQKAKAEFWKEVKVASQEIAWYIAKIQPMPALMASMSASTQVLASRTMDLSKAIHTVDWNPLSQGISNLIPVMEKTSGAFGSFFGGIKKGFTDLVSGMTGGNGLQGFMTNLGKGLVDGFGQLLAGGISSLINLGVQAAWAGIKKIGSLIGDFIGGGEHSRVNDLRDTFLAQFGGAGTGIDSGFLNLADKLTAITGQSGGGNLFAALTGAKTMEDFQRAVEAIKDVLAAFEEASQSDSAQAGAEAINDTGLSLAELAGLSEETITKLHAAMQTMGADMLAFANTLRDPVITAINETIAALDRIPRSIQIGVQYSGGSAPYAPPVVPMAEGGAGRVTKPTLFLAGERGAEDFAFSGGGRAFGGADNSDVVAEIRGLSGRLDSFTRTVSRDIAAQAAIQAGRGRSYA